MKNEALLYSGQIPRNRAPIFPSVQYYINLICITGARFGFVEPKASKHAQNRATMFA